MPVRSLNSSVFKWPEAKTVDQAARRWAAEVGAAQPEALGIAYIGSYARGDWSVGSDLDLLVLIEQSDQPFGLRAAAWDTSALPIPADVWVYTRSEWEQMASSGRRFYQEAERVAVWIFQRARQPAGDENKDVEGDRSGPQG